MGDAGRKTKPDEDAGGRVERRRLALEEARREYEAEVANVDEIDEKALRAARTAVLVLGILASVVGLSASSGTPVDVSRLEEAAVALGGLCLFGTVSAGLWTATITSYPSGVGDELRAVVQRTPTRAEAYDKLTAQYELMAEDTDREATANTTGLDITQLSLQWGIGLIFSAVASLLLRQSTPLGPVVALIVPLVLAAGLREVIVILIPERP